MDLASSVSDEALAGANVTILIIGCGEYQLIKDYAGEHPFFRCWKGNAFLHARSSSL